MSFINDEEFARSIFITIMNHYMTSLDEIHVNNTPASNYWITHGWVTVIEEQGIIEQSYILEITDMGMAILDFEKL